MIQTHVHSISVMSTLALLLTTLPVMAETDAFEVYSEAVGQSLSSIQVDDTGMTADADRWLSTRLILSAQHAFIEGLKVTASGELRLWRLMDSGSPLGLQYADDTFEHERDANAAPIRPVLHTLSLEYVTPVGLFRCGYQSAQWGTGMLVNNGRQERIFGDGWSGNRTGRCLYAARFGGAFTFFTGADYVFRDDNAEFVEDDRAYGWTAGLRYAFDGKPASETRQALSVLFAQRFQTDRSDPYHPVDKRTTLDVNSVDIHFKWHRPISPTQTLAIESEVAALFGQTTRPFLEETFENGADILAAGGVLRLSYLSPRLQTNLEAGFASGDNDPRDSTIRQFTFNQSYTVGLVLFKHVLPLMSARSIDRLADPDLLDVPPYALRFTANQGAVRNAAYAYPNVRWNITDQWAMRLAYLYAQRAADAVDPYQSAIAGGYNTAVGGGQPGGRELGHEIDAAIDFKYLFNGVELGLSAENGWFFPGDAFAGVLEEPVFTTRFVQSIYW